MAITTVISPQTPVMHRDEVLVFPEDQDTYVSLMEANRDFFSGTTIPQLNSLSSEINATQEQINASQASAAASADEALNQKNLATQQVGYAAAQVVLATNQVTLATTKANESSASAASALSAKVAIDAKVIPIEATYNYAYLDTVSNIRDLENFLDFKF